MFSYELKIAIGEWKNIVSQKKYLLLIFIFPLFSSLFFLTLMDNGLPQELPISVVDLDKSITSRKILRQLNNYKQTEIAFHAKDFNEGLKEMKKGNVYGIFCIPEGFEKNIYSFQSPQINFYINNTYLVAGSLLLRDIKSLNILSGISINLEMRKTKGEQEKNIIAELQPITVIIHPLSNPLINYSVYLCSTILPGILSLFVMLTTIYTLGDDIKHNKYKKLLAQSGNNPKKLLLWKMFPYTISYFLVLTCINIILYKYLEFPCKNGIIPIIIGGLLLVLASQAIAIFAFTILPSTGTALSITAILSILSFPMSGFTFPVTEFPPIFQAISNLFPLRHYFLLYVNNCLNEVPFHYGWKPFFYLISYQILTIISCTRLSPKVSVSNNQQYHL